MTYVAWNDMPEKEVQNTFTAMTTKYQNLVLTESVKDSHSRIHAILDLNKYKRLLAL